MGGQISSSKSKEDYSKVFDTFSYAPSSTHRTDAMHHKSVRRTGISISQSHALIQVPKQLLRTPFYSEWTMEFADGLCPSARIGQCSVYDPETDSIVIAYGFDSRGNYLNDCWALSLSPLRWRRVCESLLSPREYPSAVLVGRKMFIFGGAFENHFYADLHYIDIDTGENGVIDVAGKSPKGRTSPAMFQSDMRIYLWAGYDGRSHAGLRMFKIREKKWKKLPKTNTGVPAPAYCVHKGQFYIFGAMTGTPLSKLDPINGKLIPIQCTGTEPKGQVSHASLVSVDDYIVLIGGDFESKYMNLYALDVHRSWWFLFHVRPDGDTLSVSDGNVGKNGNFQLPREHSASVYYTPKEREIVSVMGSKMLNSTPVFKLKIAKALSYIHLFDDMLDALANDYNKFQ